MSKQAFKRVRRALGMEVSRKPLDAYAWPGGYPMYYVTSDGAALCPGCVNKEIDRVAAEIASPERHDQFRVIGGDVNWESHLTCDHCNGEIESAYGPVEEVAGVE